MASQLPTIPQETAASPAPARRKGLLLGFAALAAALLGGALWLFHTPETPPQQVALTPDAGIADAGVAVAAVSPSEGAALLAQTPANPEHAARLSQLLAREGMLNTLVAAAAMVADGDTPAPLLTFVELPGRYPVVEQQPPAPKKRGRHRTPPPAEEPRAFVDPKGYARYDELTALFTSVSAEEAGARYRKLRPYLQAAYEVIAPKGKRFDETLARAIQRLVGVKLLKEPVELERRVLIYRYKDPALEALSPAEKQLLRMGPRNGAVIQDHLKRFAVAAGLPVSS